MTFEDAVEIMRPNTYQAAATKYAKLANAANRMLDRANGTLRASKLCHGTDDFKAVSRRCFLQLNAAMRLMEWRDNAKNGRAVA